MSYIEGMAIIGIRSFSPEEANYIKFYSPLTLIVGENGCGKTTIIESMKYACTGDLPPNSRNGAFVNDPRLTGQTEVKGQIKLKFSNVRGEKMICTRSLAVSLKKTGITQRAIDSSLLRFDPVTQQTFSISSRCADMDSELPFHLGVPKAILDNVIFCHQEDSNWPFSEPSVLKKKFDDIFSSKRYQVASDSIKDTIKVRNLEIHTNNIRLEGLKSDTVKAKRIRSDVTQLTQQAAAKSETLESLQTKIERVQSESSQLQESLRDINLTEDQIQQIVNKRDFYQSTLNSLQDHITPRTESTEELKRLLQAHQTSESSTQREKSVFLNEKSQLENKLRKARQDLTQKHSTIGRLEAAREELERQIRARTELIQSINEQYHFDLPTDDGEKAAAALKKELKLKTMQAEKRKKEATDRQNVLSDELQVLKSRLLSIQESKKHLLSRIEQEKIQINALEKKTESYKVSNNEMDDIKDKIKEYKTKLEKVNSMANRSSRPDISEKETEIKKLDEIITALNEELATLSKEGDIRAKLSLKRTEKESKESAMLRLYHSSIDDVEKLIGSRPSVEQIETALLEFKNDKQNQLRDLIEARNKAQRELSGIDGKLNMVRQNLNSREKEAHKYETMCRQVCGEKNVPDELKSTESKIGEVKERLSNLGAVDSIYGKYLVGTRDAKCCPLCCRGFNDDTELDEFAGRLDQKKKSFPALRTQIEASLSKLNVRLNKLKTVQGAWIKLEQLRKDISGIQATVDQLNTEREVAAKKAEAASNEQREVDRCKIKADNLYTIAGNISRIRKEIAVAVSDISLIETELEFSGSTRTIPECQKDIEYNNDKMSIARREINRINADMENARRQARSIDSKLQEYEKELLGLQHKLDFQVGLNIQLEEMNEQLERHTKECKSIEMDFEPLNQKVMEATNVYEKEVREWRTIEESINQEEREISRQVDRVDESNNVILRNESSLGSDRLDQVKQEMERLETQIRTTTEQITKIDDRLALIEKDENDRRGIERDLQDQIRYRQTEADLKECDEDLAMLEEKQGELDIRSLKRNLSRVQEEELTLKEKVSSIRGEVLQMKNQIKHYENELGQHYGKVDAEYAELFIATKTLELAVADLGQFNKTLERAVMKYHSLKMEDLNKIIKDLWFKTYRGGDIDYIAIRADHESVAKNRSFNYRVVMYQNDNELDMRGRCSAGQKVLASIIIRLALAETFCVSCGFFTLDEPTTNLDQQNVQSLAENLRQIIESKREQPNFQFVIITHDENFVNYLGGSDLFEKYFRISKENGRNSVIHVEGEGAAPLE